MAKRRPRWRGQIQQLKRLVLKLGSHVVASDSGRVNRTKLFEIAQDVSELVRRQVEVIIISSGAIPLGKQALGQEKNPDIDFFQAASSIGQPHLFQAFSRAMGKHQLSLAQILLTHDDFSTRQRFLNARNTLNKLLENGVVPLLNENDSVSFDEITVGDNDHLAAMVALMMEADLFLLISSVDGLYDQSPQNDLAQLISTVAPQQKFGGIDFNHRSILGRGGMKSKVEALRKVTNQGMDAIVASYRPQHPLMRSLTKNVGTFFEGDQLRPKNRRKGWILATSRPVGKVVVDRGAYRAITQNNSSLLPVGVTGVFGNFKRGDCIEVEFEKQVFAIGLSEYGKGEVQRLKGVHTSEITSLLGYSPSKTIIHKDNLILKSEL